MAATITNMLRTSNPHVCNKEWNKATTIFKRMMAHKIRGFPRDVDVDTESIESLESTKKRNPGANTRNRVVTVPPVLNDTIKILVEKYGDKNLTQTAEKLNEYLNRRQMPIEEDQLRERAGEIAQMMNVKEDLEIVANEELTSHQQRQMDLIKNRLRKEIYHWQPQLFDRYGALVYIVARMGRNYSVIHRVLEEIKIRDHDFVPVTVYNYGSGSCSAVWAIHEIWNQQKKRKTHQYYCEDPSADMNVLARLLFQDGDESNNMRIKGVFIREKPPFDTSPFHMVVSAYSLLEQSSQENRVATIKKLWDMTKDYLVLVEVGNFAGHVTIQEARDFLLQTTSSQPEESKAHVLGPCPHEMICPKFGIGDGRIACTFGVRYLPLQINKVKGNSIEEKYSYLIMKKGPINSKDAHWPRIIRKSVLAKGHLHCHLCCENGDLRHYIMTKSKSQKAIYNLGRKAQWGDRLPVRLSEALDREVKEEKNKMASTEGKAKDDEISLPDFLIQTPKLPDFLESLSDEDIETALETYKDIDMYDAIQSEEQNPFDDTSSIINSQSSKWKEE